MKIENVIAEAVRQSNKANYIFSLGSVVFNRHRIIAGGYNRVYRHGSNCAEKLAILKCPNRLLGGASILVVRVNKKSRSFGMAKPCSRCMKIISGVGIKKVIYSTPHGFEELNPNRAV